MKRSFEHQCRECGKVIVLQIKPRSERPPICYDCKRRKQSERARKLIRQCLRCGQTKPVDQFIERGLVCTTCLNSARDEQSLKCCGSCNQWKPKSSFVRDSSKPDGYHARCKDCTREWRSQNKSRLVENSMRWQKENRERTSETIRRWQKNNPDYMRVTAQRRAARKRKLPVDFNQQDWEYALEYFNGCCAVCGRQMNDMFAEFYPAADHWIPLSYEGDDNLGTVPANIVPLCHGKGGCNNRKISKMPTEWLEQEFGKRKAAEILKRIETFFTTVRKTQ